MRALWLAVALAPSSALAQGGMANAPQDGMLLDARRSLVNEAEAARARGDHARALDLARRAAALRMTPSLRLFIARESQELGFNAEALGNAEQCVREAPAELSEARRQLLLSGCRAVLDAARTRVGYVLVHVGSIPEGLLVRVGAREVPAAVLGVPLVVDLGEHVIELRAPGFALFQQTVTVAAQQRVEVLATLVAQNTVAPPPTPRPTPPASPVLARSAVGPGPWVLMGMGGVLLAVGGVGLGLRTTVVCTGTCPPVREQNLTTFTILGFGGTISGGLLLVSGLAWYLAARSMPATVPVTTVALAPEQGGVRFSLGGRF